MGWVAVASKIRQIKLLSPSTENAVNEVKKGRTVWAILSFFVFGCDRTAAAVLQIDSSCGATLLWQCASLSVGVGLDDTLYAEISTGLCLRLSVGETLGSVVCSASHCRVTVVSVRVYMFFGTPRWLHVWLLALRALQPPALVYHCEGARIDESGFASARQRQITAHPGNAAFEHAQSEIFGIGWPGSLTDRAVGPANRNQKDRRTPPPQASTDACRSAHF